MGSITPSRIIIREGEQGGSRARQANDIIVLIDVLRATTSITTALGNGAKAIIPVKSIDEARNQHDRISNSLLCGERNGRPPKGFSLGNSPLEFIREVISGKTLILTTSNCTRVLHSTLATPIPYDDAIMPLLAGCLRNLDAIANRLRYLAIRLPKHNITLLAAGKQGTTSPDDHIAAQILRNHLIGVIDTPAVTPSSLLTILQNSPHGQELIRQGFTVDLQFAAEINTSSIIPELVDDRFQIIINHPELMASP